MGANSFLNEYGIGRIFRHDWSRFDEQAFTRVLMREPLRSEIPPPSVLTCAASAFGTR